MTSDGAGFKSAALLLAGAAVGALALYAGIRFAGPDHDEAPAPPPAAIAQPGVFLDPATLKEVHIRVAPLAFATTQGQVSGYARALDLSPLAAIAAEATAARAAAAASGAEAARLAALVKGDAGASLKELQAARAQATADQARLTLACQRAGLEYGPGLARLGCNALVELARDAASGQLAVLRLDFPSAALPTGAAVTLDLAPGSTLVRVLGPAAAGDSQLQTAGSLAVLRGDLAARAGVGRIISAHVLAGSAQAGLIVPREAIVRTDGGLFAWRVLKPGTYERVPLENAVAEARGWFVPAGQWKAGDQVVVSGAGTLLGMEHAPAAAAAAAEGDD